MNTIRADSHGKLPAVLDNIAKQGNPLVAVMKDGSLCVTIKDDFTGGGGGGTGSLLTGLDPNRQIVISASDSILQALGYAAYKLNSLSGLSVGPAGGELAGNYPNPTVQNAAVIAKLLTGLNTGLAGNISATDSLLVALGKVAYQLGLINAALFRQLLADPDFDSPGLPDWSVSSGGADGVLTRVSDGLGGFMAKFEPTFGTAGGIFQDPILLDFHNYHISGEMWIHGFGGPVKPQVSQGGVTPNWSGIAADDVWQTFSFDFHADNVSGNAIQYGLDSPPVNPNGYIYIDKLSVIPILM